MRWLVHGRIGARVRKFGWSSVVLPMLLVPAGAFAAGSAGAGSGRVAAHPPTDQRGKHPPARASVPTPGAGGQLYTNICASRSDCWAVGYRGTSASATLNQAVHWTGKRWREVSVPQPGGTAAGDRSTLEWIACTSAFNCWAVGYYDNSAKAELNEALRWNGSRWKLVNTPQPGKTRSYADQSYLYGVSCASASDCWAVGAYTNARGATVNQALRWNGKKWAKVSTPQPAGTRTGRQNVLYSVTCTSASNCWAPGIRSRHPAGSTVNEMLRWTGKKWRSVNVPHPGGTGPNAHQYIEQVACTSGCWGVGAYEKPGNVWKNAAMRWNGRKWTLTKVPQPGGTAGGDQNHLWSIDCSATSDCWAVGDHNNHTGAMLNQALRWKGKMWKLVKTPQPGGTTAPQDQNVLYSISCLASSYCSAVGFSEKSATLRSRNQALRWTGRKWRKN